MMEVQQMADPQKQGQSKVKARGNRAPGKLAEAASAAAAPAADDSSGQNAMGTVVSRPQIPAVYGLPKHNKDLLPWSYVRERMAQAQVYWITTVDPDGRPHA